jgi:polyhydroxybutyrate depolymerase
MNRVHWLAALPWAGLLVAAACSSSNSSPSTVVSSGSETSGTQGESSGSAMPSGAAAPSGQGAGASAGAATGSSSGGAGSGMVPGSGMGDSGAGGSASGAGGGGTGSSSGLPDTGGGASGTMLDSGPPGDDAASAATFPHGPSLGCGQSPGVVNSSSFTNTKITIPTCGGALTYPDCIDPHFAPGFTPASASSYATNNGEDYNNRDYNIELPANYDPSTPYPIFFGGAGCGAGGNGFDVNSAGAIKVHLSIMNGCFADGGTSCAGNVANEPNCKMGPELPYFRAVLAEVESKFCVDRARVFVGGYSSGAWEAITLGCGAANQIRGTTTLEGGWRNDQPACTGPLAALLVAGGIDGTNPIGPLVENMAYPAGGLSATQVNSTISDLDSNGSAPARDAVLQRNHCVGTATAPYDPKYPDCVKYTGCPAEYPVVWCEIPMCAHICSTDNNVNYSPGSVQGDPLMWNFLSNLPAVN